jgi:hypothetical protein
MAANTTTVTATIAAYQLVADGQEIVHLHLDSGAQALRDASDLERARVFIGTSLPAAGVANWIPLIAGVPLKLEGLSAADKVYVRAESGQNIVRAVSWTSTALASTPPAGSVGVAQAGAVATEWGDQVDHTTVLVLTNFPVGTSGDNANLALGALLYTFPAGIIQIDSSALVALGVTAAISVTTDTPEVGLGTTQAAGAHATLGAVAATAENISEGGDTTNIAPDVAGTATVNSSKKPTVASGDDGPLIIPAASAHMVYLNVADGWADVTAAGAVTVSGTVVINWKKLT